MRHLFRVVCIFLCQMIFFILFTLVIHILTNEALCLVKSALYYINVALISHFSLQHHKLLDCHAFTFCSSLHFYRPLINLLLHNDFAHFAQLKDKIMIYLPTTVTVRLNAKLLHSNVDWYQGILLDHSLLVQR